jgi:hypothetical protein
VASPNDGKRWLAPNGLPLWEISPAGLGDIPTFRPVRQVTTSQITWESVRLTYRHTWMGATVQFRWRSCTNLQIHCKCHIIYLIVIRSISSIVIVLKKCCSGAPVIYMEDALSVWCSSDADTPNRTLDSRDIDCLCHSHIGVPYWSQRSVSSRVLAKADHSE